METDAEKFKRLATRRVNMAIKHIRLIGNLSNKTNYQFNRKDVQKIFSTLKREIADTEELFQNKERRQKFTLGETP